MSFTGFTVLDLNRQLRIPMRGYERIRALFPVYGHVRYESPCGVMSWRRKDGIQQAGALRIPMRGYEVSCKPSWLGGLVVTNPHAGL